MEIREISEHEFDGFVAGKTVLVDFYANWCGACRSLAKILGSMQDEVPETLEIGKVDIEKFPELAARFGVMTLPHVMLYRDGVRITEKSGFISKRDVLELFKRFS